MKAFNSLKMGEIDPSQINDESEEAKDSSSIINQNIALSLIKRSNSNSNSNNKSSDQISKVSSVSDIKNSSFVEEDKSKTDQSQSNRTGADNTSQGNNTFPTLRKISTEEAKSDKDDISIRKFSLLKPESIQNRSRSFSKSPNRKKECKRKRKGTDSHKSKHSKHCKHRNKEDGSHHCHHRHDKDHDQSDEHLSSNCKTPVMYTRAFEHPHVQMFKAFSPKIGVRRNYLAENLKHKAEELAMRRINNERRKNTNDYQLDKLIKEETEISDSDDDKLYNATNAAKDRLRNRKHKGSISKPLDEDYDERSPPK